MSPINRYPPRLSSSETLTGYVQPAPANKTGATYQEQHKKIINYKLPPPVRDAVQGWKDACGSISIISPLSTAVVTALLQILKSPTETLQAVLYTSIVFNLGATTCAVLCLFMLSDFTTKARVIAAKDKNSLPEKCLLNDDVLYTYIEEDKERELLRGFGLGRSWSISKAAMTYCFLFGTICTFVGLGIGVWYQHVNYAAAVVTTALVLVGGASGFVLLLLINGE